MSTTGRSVMPGSRVIHGPFADGYQVGIRFSRATQEAAAVTPSQPSHDDTAGPGAGTRPGGTDARPTAPEHGPRGRPRAAWTAVTVGVVLAVLLVVFIAQNTQKVTISFLFWDGDVPLAVGLLVAAVLGAGLVLVIGTIRVTQLKLAERRQRHLNRERQ